MALFIWFCAAAFFLQSRVLPAAADKLYIVHMDTNLMPDAYNTQSDWYADHLQTLTAAESGKIMYTYEAAYPGYAAALSPEEADALRQSDAVLGVYEDTVYNLHTTRTPEFLGLNGEQAGHTLQQLNQASYDVIIGVLDTGVWPESKSFSDTGMPDVPARWRGMCQVASDFESKNCNKKLIGAKSFSEGYRGAVGKTNESMSARDYNGHGTHTASTAAGTVVSHASFFGYASGNARGMATQARIAAYKVCWNEGCMGSDILAGIDSAIQDGVDVLSMSLGGPLVPYYQDTTAIGTFAAMEKGIFVSCSAGNAGPTPGSLSNVVPWIMTVGASTIDRSFPAYIALGNNKNFTGVSLYSGEGMGKDLVELVYNTSSNGPSNLCQPGSLNATQVKGKVVVCDRGGKHLGRAQKGAVVKAAGGVGMILANTEESGGEELLADSHVLPAVAVGQVSGDAIKKYVKTDKKPMAVLSLFGETVVKVKPAPMVAAFSSRGPNVVTPEILKPDVIGPGVDILAAWSGATSPTELPEDTRRSLFNIISGTSMSCPHISGLAALVKAAHPDWSPSAIKSALMTTAYTLDNNNSPISDANDKSYATPHAMGAGHVDPIKALSPGLVYNTTPNDYLAFLCSLGYNRMQIQAITRNNNETCTELKSKFNNPAELNYPSFSVLFNNPNVSLTRKLTSVEPGLSVYNVSVKAPPNVKVTVNPTSLVFKGVGDSLSYTVTFLSESVSDEDAFGSISWNNEKHMVTSPVAYSWAGH
ncbi:Subtilase family protein [Striga hermonthica]|uniref:Subtilase family protein n=1 Tax=Striga hermonthica TaxID=68872 RepID=A0A9N7MPE7_STRHE|nr:Subtilase family protein [Striga hermonthica]